MGYTNVIDTRAFLTRRFISVLVATSFHTGFYFYFAITLTIYHLNRQFAMCLLNIGIVYLPISVKCSSNQVIFTELTSTHFRIVRHFLTSLRPWAPLRNYLQNGGKHGGLHNAVTVRRMLRLRGFSLIFYTCRDIWVCLFVRAGGRYLSPKSMFIHVCF